MYAEVDTTRALTCRVVDVDGWGAVLQTLVAQRFEAQCQENHGSQPATCVSVSRRGQSSPRSDPERTVVWVRGEHDIATAQVLAEAMARAVRLDDADVVVDLSGVDFMDASTVGAIIRTRNLLSTRSRALHVRAPSPPARRLLQVCHLADLVEPDRSGHALDKGSALTTWVAVPATARQRPSSESEDPERDSHDLVSAAATAAGSPIHSEPAVDHRRQGSG